MSDGRSRARDQIRIELTEILLVLGILRLSVSDHLEA